MTSSNSNEDNNAQLQHQLFGDGTGRDGDHTRNTHPGAQWYEGAGLGLFIHWGISSVQGEIDLSWGMIDETPWDTNPKVKPEDYFKLAERFNPDNYDPDIWLKAAAEAGFTYAVLTTRHCDGYALWPSKYGQFSTRTHLNGRDLVRPFVEACRRYNLKVGLYYSPADWYYNRDYMSFGFKYLVDPKGSIALGLRHQPVTVPVTLPEWREQFLQYIRNQVIELLTDYGTIDVMWFDGGLNEKDSISQDEIRRLQPGIIISPRMHGFGDYVTTECGNIADIVPSKPNQKWEHCDIWHYGNSWGYHQKCEKYKSTTYVLSLLSKVRAWGGNLLINIGPKPDGTLPDAAYESFGELKDWLSLNHQAVFAVESGDFPLLCNVPSTKRGDSTLYLHILPEHAGPVIAQEVSKPVHVRLLRTGEDVPFEWNDRCLHFTIPVSFRGDSVDIFEVQF